MSRVPGIEVFERFSAMAEGIGFKVGKAEWEFGCIATALIKFGRRNVAELDFGALGDHVRLLVHPVGSMKITGGSGRIVDVEGLDRELEELESLFRTWLVLNKKLEFDDYPTNAALQGWVRTLSEKPSGGQPIGDRCIAVASEMSAHPFDRPKALRFHAIAAEIDVPSDDQGRLLDRVAGYARQSAQAIAEGRYGRQALAWKDGSSMAFLHLRERPGAPERAVEPLVMDMPALSPVMR